MGTEERSNAELLHEIERLTAENQSLKDKMGPTKEAPHKKKRGGFWRGFVVWFLIVFACIFAFGGVLAGWVRSTTLNTDNFVNTIGPLVRDEAVSKVISTEAVDILWEKYKVENKIEEAIGKLPKDLEFIAGPISTGLRTIAQKAAQEVLRSEQFEWVWEKILRTAHKNAVEALTGKGAVKITKEGEVELNLGELVNEVKKQLVGMGFSFLEGVNIPVGEVTLFKAKQLGMVKTIVKLLDTLNWVLPVLSLVFFIAAILIASDRRKALMGSGIGIAIAMAVVLISLRLTRTMLLGKVNPADREAAMVVWNQLTAGLKGPDIGFLVFGLVVAAACLVAGPYDWAVTLRGKTAELFTSIRERRKGGEAPVGAIGKFISEHAWGIRIAGVAVALLLLLVCPMSLWLVIIVGVVLLVYLAAIELLR